MKNKKSYLAPEATIIRLETYKLICLSGGYDEEVTTGDANARKFSFDDIEE